jgi:polyphosphate kinase
MPRNINRRVEVLFPVEGPDLVRHVRDEILAVYLTGTVKGRQMKSDGTYVRRTVSGGKRAVNTQEWLLKQAAK